MMIEKLTLWMDPEPRPGPEAMAVDEWLLESARSPVLRVYRWLGDWGSIGYFGIQKEAAAAFPPELGWVRRWTGGGTVDHRNDWTYTLVAPSTAPISRLRGAESYRIIHEALAGAIRDEGLSPLLSDGAAQTGAALCFENPVSHDLLDGNLRKLAGAGQRRSKFGLLHQGSVASSCSEEASAVRSGRFASRLAGTWENRSFHPPEDVILAKIQHRYGSERWTLRR